MSPLMLLITMQNLQQRKITYSMAYNELIKPFQVICSDTLADEVQCVASSPCLPTLTPTHPAFVSEGGSKPFRQLAANRCLRGFINMSGIDTIFESVTVCVQTSNHLDACPGFDQRIPLFLHTRWTSRSITSTQTHSRCSVLKSLKTKTTATSFFTMNQNHGGLSGPVL